jgi:katanin p60 ATPase-containing subunit A1
LPWEIDEALRRRLEKRVYIPLPDLNARAELFKISLKTVKVEADVDLMNLAELTEGYSGHDISNIARDASMMTLRRRIKGMRPDEIRNLKKDEVDLPISMADFQEAITKVSSSVGKHDLEKYNKWMEEFGAS